MKNILIWISLTLTTFVGAVVSLNAQAPEDKRARPPEATVYRDANYKGPALFIGGEKPNIGLVWPVNSIRVKNGRWQLCSQTQYRGHCRTIDRDTPRLDTASRGLTIRSIRPLDATGGGGWNPSPVASDRTVRGNFAEFHTQPSDGRYRVPACNSGAAMNCAAKTADEWCRSIGWNGSAREHVETVDRREYLADVLCVRSNYEG